MFVCVCVCVCVCVLVNVDLQTLSLSEDVIRNTTMKISSDWIFIINYPGQQLLLTDDSILIHTMLHRLSFLNANFIILTQNVNFQKQHFPLWDCWRLKYTNMIINITKMKWIYKPCMQCKTEYYNNNYELSMCVLVQILLINYHFSSASWSMYLIVHYIQG